MKYICRKKGFKDDFRISLKVSHEGKFFKINLKIKMTLKIFRICSLS